MTILEFNGGKRLSPLVHLSNNWLSLAGVVIITTATVFWLFLLPTTLKADVTNPYIGILAYLVVPAAFFVGLALIPLGIFLRHRNEVRAGKYPSLFPPLTFRNPDFRRLVIFIVLTTFVNIVISSQLTYGAVTYMESVTFCGQTCHTVMQPEFVAYQNSPHSRVECVKCHIGPGASWFVKSKLSGVGQVLAVTFHTYSTPIPTPVANLRPARETCETCHWPQKYGTERLRIVPKFADDETNTLSKTVLLMRISGNNAVRGIHGAHLGEGVTIRYAHADEKRQTIPWVEYSNAANGSKHEYTAADFKGDVKSLPVRDMDCMDCHTRPSHSFDLPERAVDRALYAGQMSPVLPFLKKKSVEILKQSYGSREQANQQIPLALDGYYRESYAQIYGSRRGEIARAGEALASIYNRNVFPAMKVTWGTYPNNIGHTDYPGCFRCHDEQHASKDGSRKIMQDCNGCHSLLAMEEAAPKILADLGVADVKPAEAK